MARAQDPLTQRRTTGRPVPPDRVHYAEGVMLDATDFTAEQTYHRSRLARTLAYLHGWGTVCGLRVVWEAGVEAGADPELPDGREERLRVQPGLAIDRLGRIIEVPADACIRLDRWYDAQDPAHLATSLTNGPAGSVTADVFARFTACERGKTPAFASGPFDALDAAVAARLRDSYALDLVLRIEIDPPLPDPLWNEVDPGAPLAARRRALEDAQLDGWREGSNFFDGNGHLKPQREHAAGQDSSAVFIARVALPATDGGAAIRPTRTAGADVTVDNHSRQFVHPGGALARWVGI